MNEIEKEFVPYQESLELKELGFDEPCISWFNVFGKFSNDYSSPKKYNSEFKISGGYISAPTFSQAFRWFREKYNLKGFISPVEYLDGTDDTYHWCIYNYFNSGNDQLTHEEAELACLRKMIEIVKEQ